VDIEISSPWSGHLRRPLGALERAPQFEIAMLLGSSSVTRFSYIEYQAIMLGLAGVMCLSMAMVEISINRFHVLPLLFPGMFTIRNRRLFAYNVDITDGKFGGVLRTEAKVIVRTTLCVSLSYLWQHCVLVTSQDISTEWPSVQCSKGYECFASKMSIVTFFNRHFQAIDCSSPRPAIAEKSVISCLKLVPPSATTWLMHLGIAHSVSQLTLKSFEVLVWIAGSSRWLRHVFAASIVFTLTALVTLMFADVLTKFMSSWLSFVMTLATPLFLNTVRRSGQALESAMKEEHSEIQMSIKISLDTAFADIEQNVAADMADVTDMETDNENENETEDNHLTEGRRSRLTMKGVKNFFAALPVFISSRTRVIDSPAETASNDREVQDTCEFAEGEPSAETPKQTNCSSLMSSVSRDDHAEVSQHGRNRASSSASSSASSTSGVAKVRQKPAPLDRLE